MKRAILGTAMAAYFGVAAAAVFAPPAQARPITPAERRYSPLQGALPYCDDPSVLASISSGFAEREQDYWKSGLLITHFDHVREIGYRTPGHDFVPRRYCEASADFNDLKARRVTYWVGAGQGFAGFGWGTDWCITGLDHDVAYDYACRAARP